MKKWYKTWWGISILIGLFPFAVPYLIFTETKYNIFVKSVLSLFVFLFFVVLSAMTPKEEIKQVTNTGSLIEEKKEEVKKVEEVKKDTPEEYLKKNEWEAMKVCTKDIQNKLKSPKSAEFEDWKTLYTGTGTNQALVMGQVDAQNEFGALIRSSYICTFDWNGSDFFLISAEIIE